MMIHNANFNRLAPLKEDSLSRDLKAYQFSLLSIGHFLSPKNRGISNTSLPWHRIIYVMTGPIRYTIHDVTLVLDKGDVLYTPPNTIYSACSIKEDAVPEFLYLYFHVFPCHKEQDFIYMMETAGKIRIFHALRSPVEFYFHTIMEEYKNLRPGYYQKIHSYLILIVMELLRQKCPKQTCSSPASSSDATLLLNKATSYIAANIREPLRISEISHTCGISESYLYKIFSSSLGVSPKEYILNCKMEYAAQLLKAGTLTITQIARELGFSNPNHFSNAFLKATGIRPSRYHSSAPQ